MKLFSSHLLPLTVATLFVPGAVLLNGCSGGGNGSFNNGNTNPTPGATRTPAPTGTPSPTPTTTLVGTYTGRLTPTSGEDLNEIEAAVFIVRDNGTATLRVTANDGEVFEFPATVNFATRTYSGRTNSDGTLTVFSGTFATSGSTITANGTYRATGEFNQAGNITLSRGASPTPSPTRTATPRPTTTATPRPTATPTPRPTTTPVSFAGNYAGGLRFGNGVTSGFTFRINSNNSITNTTPGDDAIYTGSVSSTGALRLTTSDENFGNITVNGQLTRSGSAVSGSGTATTSSAGNGTLTFRSATPASPFAGVYRGPARITAGDGAGTTFPFRVTVLSNGIVSVEDGDNAGQNVIDIIEGTISGSRATGTIRSTAGFRATFTAQR